MQLIFSQISIGLGHIVGVSLDHGVFAWGDNSYGQLGLGDLEPRDKATEVALLRGKSITK